MEQIAPAPWLFLATYLRKPNEEVSVCLGNQAIIHECHKLRMVEDVAHKTAGVVVYLKGNAPKAFLQIHLTYKASLLTTFNTH